jgi:hypothetical protein
MTIIILPRVTLKPVNTEGVRKVDIFIIIKTNYLEKMLCKKRIL